MNYFWHMAELYDQDLDRLFRHAGHKEPVSDLTERIMSRVAVTAIIRPTKVKPLIGKWGWGAILLCSLSFVGLVLALAPAQGMSISPIMTVPGTWLNGFALPSLPSGNWPVWLAGASACVLLFTLQDRLLTERLGGKQH